MQNPDSPPKDRPFWVLFDRGLTHSPFRGPRGHKISLVAYEWDGGGFRRVEGEEERWPTSAYRAIEAADWVGRLPQQRRGKFNPV